MATADSTGLVKNTDFSAELLLNKVMNKQYRTQNGNTLTLAGRINASKLDAQAKTFGVQAENLAKEVTWVDAEQGFLTELAALAKKAQEVSSLTDSAQKQKLGTELQNQLTALLKTTVDGTVLSAGTARTADLGLGAGAFTLGFASNSVGIDTLSSVISSLAAGGTATAISASLDTAVNALYTGVGVYGEKAALIHNRYDALNDLAASYANASNDQVVTEGGNATSLLNTLL